MRVSTRERESAFTIVEVLVAALIVTMVFAGGVYFVVGGGKAQQKTLVRQKMAAAADNISQRVRADQQWLNQKPACKTQACDVSGLFPVAPAKPNDPKLTASVGIRPIDGEGDGLGSSDSDHVRPDFYRIEIRVTMSAAEQQKWGVQKPFETVSTVDATALGRAVGSLVVQTCETVNQVDERMSIAGCDGAGALRDMHRQPEPCKSPFPMSFAEWVTPGRRPVLPLGCNNAFNAAGSRTSFMTGVQLRSVDTVAFRLERDNSDGGPATTRLYTDADGPTTNGTYVFSGLPAGSYTITAAAGAGRELWETKMVPSKGRASVQGNQEARALIVTRPKQGAGKYGVRFTRTTWHYRLATEKATESEDIVGAGMTVRVTTTYTYLVAKGPTTERWEGPAWSGFLAMEPKPFDRYRDGSLSVTQPAKWIAWDDSRAPNNGWVVFDSLPTGLASLPQQQPTPTSPPDDTWGDFGTRTQNCNSSATPGGQCDNFAWLDHRPGKIGEANGSISFHSEDGECYLHGNVAPFNFGRKLQNGGGHADRCSRDFLYVNPQTGKRTWIPNFLPDKSGNGGGRMLIGMTQTSACVANCEYASGGGTVDLGYADPSSNNVGSVNAPAPRASTTKTPPVKNNPPPPAPDSGGGGGGGGGGGSTGGTLPATGSAVPSAVGGSGGSSSPLSPFGP